MPVSEEKKKRKLISPSEFAELLGVSKRAVNDAIQHNRLDKSVKTETNGHNKLDAIEACFEWFENADLSKDHQGRLHRDQQRNNEGELSYAEAQRVRENYRAFLTRIEYEEKLGNLVPRDAAETALFEHARTLRDKFLSLPETLGPRVAGLDRADSIVLLRNEIERILGEFANASK